MDPKQITRHTLRHTAITHLVQAGVDLPTVKRISGHKTLQMVEKYSNQKVHIFRRLWIDWRRESWLGLLLEACMTVKIYLIRNEILLNFMWADAKKDGTVLMGIDGSNLKGSVEKIFDIQNELLPGKHFKVKNEIAVNNSVKISFHASGRYKLMQKIKKIFTDRVTVQGLPLREIVKPVRMLEILIPANLKIAKSIPRAELDEKIDITSFPPKPLRCTVSCMHRKEWDSFSKNKVLGTSLYEKTHAYEFNNLIWAWTISISENDEYVHQTKYIVFIPGKIIWPTFFKKIGFEIKSILRNYILR